MSEKISYRMADGKMVELEVSDEFAAGYAEFEHEEKKRTWRDKKRKHKEVSLEMLMERGYDFPDPINRSPEEMYIEKQEVRISVLGNLTEYQKRVATKYYAEHKGISQIAREEGVSKQTISRLLDKIKDKIVSQFS